MADPLTAEEQARVLRPGRAPHDLVKTVAGVLWECISYPYPDGTTAWVMIREPGDPTTLRAVEAVLVHPEGITCSGCDHGEFYFKERADRQRTRAVEAALWEAAGQSTRPRSWPCDVVVL